MCTKYTERRDSNHNLTRVHGVSCDLRATLWSVPSACFRLAYGEGQ